MSEKITHIAGTFLIKAEGAFLNGGGLESGEYQNVTAPKFYWDIDKSGRRVPVPYVSAQAWRHWLRETFREENPDEPISELKALKFNAKGNPSKIGTEMNPIVYAEDDIFGYMKASEGQGKDKKTKKGSEEADLFEELGEETDKKEKTEKTKSVMRPSPFVSSILKSIRKDSTISEDEGYVHLKQGTPLPYTTKFYNTQLQGIFGLNYSRLGVFRNDGDRIELDEIFVKQYSVDGKLNQQDGNSGIYEVSENKRLERATMILKSLAVLRGGAKQAQFGTDVTPKVIIVAGLNCGNLIFNDLFTEEKSEPIIKIKALKQIIREYQNRLATHVFIGIRTGYLLPQNEEDVENFAKENTDIVRLASPIEAVNGLTNEMAQAN